MKENQLLVKIENQLVGLLCLISPFPGRGDLSAAVGWLHNFLNEGMSLFWILIGQHWSLL